MSTTLSDDDVVTQNIMCVFESYCDDMKKYMGEKCARMVVQRENFNGKFGW